MFVRKVDSTFDKVQTLLVIVSYGYLVTVLIVSKVSKTMYSPKK